MCSATGRLRKIINNNVFIFLDIKMNIYTILYILLCVQLVSTSLDHHKLCSTQQNMKKIINRYFRYRCHKQCPQVLLKTLVRNNNSSQMYLYCFFYFNCYNTNSEILLRTLFLLKNKQIYNLFVSHLIVYLCRNYNVSRIN